MSILLSLIVYLSRSYWIWSANPNVALIGVIYTQQIKFIHFLYVFEQTVFFHDDNRGKVSRAIV